MSGSIEIEIIKKENQKTSTWAGGTTTELAIYPKGSSYSEGRFVWRLSSARVELEESTFTSLPGIWRYLMVIEGEMHLEHLGHHSIHLKPYEKDSFSGSWTTLSKGKVRDFNLMLAEGYNGEIQALSVNDEIVIKDCGLYDSCEYTVQALYCTEGEVEIKADGESAGRITEGDLVVISENSKAKTINLTIGNSGSSMSRIIRAVVFK